MYQTEYFPDDEHLDAIGRWMGKNQITYFKCGHIEINRESSLSEPQPPQELTPEKRKEMHERLLYKSA